MKGKILVFNILVFKIGLLWRGTTATSSDTLFMKESTMANLRCSASSTDIGEVRSIKHCGMMCSSMDSCKSFFYNSPLRTCWISSVIFDTASGCVAESGTVYFRQNELVVYGSVCTADTDCTMPNMVCQGGVCQCEQWYLYDSTTGQCTDSCSTYGTSYSAYIGTRVNVPYTSVSVTSVQGCLDACSASPTCRGVTTCCMPFPVCRLKDGTPLSHPGSNSYDPGFGVDYYMRKCA